MTTLHITNGDCAISLLREAGIQGDFLPWRDILHMGPVPANYSLSALSDIRAAFISSLGWGELEQIKADFVERDYKLNQAREYAQIVFWFEHDLYDQLQILQLFDWLADNPKVASKSFLINPNKHITHHCVSEITSLYDSRKPVETMQLQLAQKAWQAYRLPNLDSWQQLTNQDTSAFPYLHDSIIRSLDELPASSSGCTQTETLILTLVASGINEKTLLFQQYCKCEKAPFHGDSGFYWYLQQMSNDQPALIDNLDDKLSLTEMGKLVLLGKQKWQRRYQAQHWLGGYCISK